MCLLSLICLSHKKYSYRIQRKAYAVMEKKVKKQLKKKKGKKKERKVSILLVFLK